MKRRRTKLRCVSLRSAHLVIRRKVLLGLRIHMILTVLEIPTPYEMVAEIEFVYVFLVDHYLLIAPIDSGRLYDRCCLESICCFCPFP